jgi:ribosomal protein L35
MARQKTNKTAKKRVKMSNPRGAKKGIMRFKQSHQGHLRTKKSAREKRRQSDSKPVPRELRNKMKNKIINI